MSENKSAEMLREWNRLNKENAEQAMVSAMFQAFIETSNIIDKFSTWLLAGTGATIALFITQINSILPHISQKGYKYCLLSLIFSAALGILSKYYSLRCEIQANILSKIITLFSKILETHGKAEDKIAVNALNEKIELETGINMSKVITDFLIPFPKITKFFITRKISNSNSERQGVYYIAVRLYLKQLSSSFLQSICFILFAVTAMFYTGKM